MIRNDHATRFASRKRSDYIPGVMVVRWKDDVFGDLPVTPRTTRSLAPTLPAHISDPLSMLRRRFGLRSISRVDVDAPFLPERAVRRSMAPAAVTVLKLGTTADREVQSAVRMLRNDRSILYAEPAARRWLATLPNDPKYNVQWSLPVIKWPGASRPDASRIHVGIIDSGVDRSHPDLKNSIAGYDHNGSGAADLIGHGTHVAGILAAGLNDHIGVCGIANCRLHCWKVFTDEADADSVDNAQYYRALNAVLNSSGDQAIRILNLSIGGTAPDRTEQLLIDRLVKKGVMIVAAMGNEYLEGNPIEYPASLRGVLAVGAVRANLNRAAFSNTGSHIGIAAPGVGILSTLPRKKSKVREEVLYEAWDGTSMATPIVSAAAALVWAKNPSFNAKQVQQVLTDYSNTTHPPGMKSKRWTKAFGSGVVNLNLALR